MWDIEDEASPCRRVVSGLSWGSLASSVNIEELASQDTAGEASDIRSVLAFQVFQSLLLLPGSVAATTRVEVSSSVDRLTASSGLLLVSVKICVCSVSAEKEKNNQYYQVCSIAEASLFLLHSNKAFFCRIEQHRYNIRSSVNNSLRFSTTHLCC